MSTNRYVPLIMGVGSLCLAGWLMFAFSGWWRYIPGVLLFILGWGSLKTAIFATDKEIKELTRFGPMSEETAKKLEERMK